MEKRYVTVFSLRMCNSLLHRGFHIAEVGRDKRYPENVVFFFENSQTVRKAIEEIANKK